MDLSTKLKEIDKPKLKTFTAGCDYTIHDFFTHFIEPRLPFDTTIKKMHSELIKYVKSSSFVSVIRIFNEDNDNKIRRGFFTKTPKLQSSYFYTDNSFAYFFAKIASDNECPDYLFNDLVKMMNDFSFPYKYIIGGSKNSEKKYAAFPAWTKNPGYGFGYKLAHVFDVGGDKGCGYYYKGKEFSVSEICDLIFKRGVHSDWLINSSTKKYERNNLHIEDVDLDLAQKFLVASFLRFTDPLNYFWAPRAPYKGIIYNHFDPFDNKKPNDIGEYKPLLQFVSLEFEKRYPVEYKEFTELIMLPPNRYSYNKEIGLPINLEYDPCGLAKYSIPHKCAAVSSTKSKTSSGVGQYAKSIFNDLLISGNLKPCLISNLMNKDYCSKNLGISYPVLVNAVSQTYDKTRYYKDIVNGDYLICSQWYIKSQTKIDVWLKTNKLK